ncbi:MAG: TetR/AcrR family transcriptional regulator [Roseiflexaceae bacterium]
MADAGETFNEQVAALRRAQILDAATNVFAEKGFHRSTIRDVARAAGVADGTIYNYFANKTALLVGILDRITEPERRGDSLAAMGQGDLRAFFRDYFRQRLSALGGSGLKGLRVVISEMLVDAELRQNYVERVVAPSAVVAEPHFQRLLEGGQLHPGDTPLLLRAISGMFLGLIVQRLLGDPQLEAEWERLPDLLTTLLLDGLLPRQGAGG